MLHDVFFFPSETSSFFKKEIGIFWIFFPPSVNLTIFKILKSHKNLGLKKMKKKKKH